MKELKQTFTDRLRHAWSALNGKQEMSYGSYSGNSIDLRGNRLRMSFGADRNIVDNIYNRIAIDVAQVDIRHVRLDQNGRFKEEMNSYLNECLKVQANIDQTGREFIQDIVESMFEEGQVAVVPVETDLNPNQTEGYDIHQLRVGKVLEHSASQVRLEVYDERDGIRKEIVQHKKFVAIIQNPFYNIMNESGALLPRLTRKLALLDSVDEQSGSGKLDIIIQLPYVVKTDKRREEAEKRAKDIEMQLSGSRYGIAYTDGTERITQLNRPAENNLMKQVEYLTSQLYNELGLTEAIFDGTADESAMLNYYNRTVEPILAAITEKLRAKFLSKTARSRGQTIMYQRDPFKLVPVSAIAEIADKFTRNEILSPNDVRAIIGYRPSTDPTADELRNRNLNQSVDAKPPPKVDAESLDKETEEVDQEGANQNGI